MHSTFFKHALRRSGVRRRSRPSRTGVVLGTTGLLLAAGVSVLPAAFAADGPFTIDGNVPDTGVTNLDDPEGNVKELGPLNSSTTKIGVIHNDALPTLGLTNPNAQVDLRQAWLGTARDTAAPNHDWLYFAW